MNNTEIIINALSKGSGGGGGGGVAFVDFDTPFEKVREAIVSGKVVMFGGEVSIVTPLAPSGYINVYVEINGANYIDLTPIGAGEQIFFHTIYDATTNPLLGKLMSVTVTCHDNDVWDSSVKFIDTAT